MAVAPPSTTAAAIPHGTVGALGASSPANESAAPLVAVVLGAALIHENVPVGAGTVLAYAACLAVILAATIRLANPPG